MSHQEIINQLGGNDTKLHQIHFTFGNSTCHNIKPIHIYIDRQMDRQIEREIYVFFPYISQAKHVFFFFPRYSAQKKGDFPQPRRIWCWAMWTHPATGTSSWCSKCRAAGALDPTRGPRGLPSWKTTMLPMSEKRSVAPCYPTENRPWQWTIHMKTGGC